MEKLVEGSTDGLSIYRISLQAWYAFVQLCGSTVSLGSCTLGYLLCSVSLGLLIEDHNYRTKYTRAFVRRLPYHRSLPILFWLFLARILRWKPPVPQVRNRVIRYRPEHFLHTVGLSG